MKSPPIQARVNVYFGSGPSRKTCPHRLKTNSILLIIAISAGGLPEQVLGQTFTTLYSFNGQDGDEPQHSKLIVSEGTLYGQTSHGGIYRRGNIFRCSTSGSGFDNLYSFTPSPDYTNTDGGEPVGNMVMSGTTLYGVASSGGAGGNGTVFALKVDGTAFTVLHHFAKGSSVSPFDVTNEDGALPIGGLVISSNVLYGTTMTGGRSAQGTVFKVNSDGSGFAVIHTFTGPADGANPLGTLILSADALYGTANGGGSSGNGTVFKVNTDGTGWKTLHSFSGGTNGAVPETELVLSGTTLYGTTTGDSLFATTPGTVFALNTDGSGFVNLRVFTTGPWPSPNQDGAWPVDGMILSDNILYGTTESGGAFGSGTVFKVNTNGTGFKTLHTFTTWFPNNKDGFNPKNKLTLADGTLYGMTGYGGDGQYGTIFSISLPTPSLLKISSTAVNVILNWPTNSSHLYLQSTTNLASPSWTTNHLPAPVVLNGQYTMTNPLSVEPQFFRLAK